MASKIKKQVQDELLNVMELLDEGSTKYSLLESLYNQVEKLDNDKDIVNTVWANKDLPLRMFTTDELEMMPGFNNLLVGEPRMGLLGGEPKVVEKNLEKAFGKDWVSNFENIPYNQIALVAEKNGEDPDTLLYAMRDKATAKRREDIAHGRWDPNDPWYYNVANEIGGVALDLFGKRQQEAIERGEEPSYKDKLIDIAESGLQAVPYGMAARVLTGPAKKALVGALLSNAGGPFVTEALDAVAYDESNPGRDKFSWGDVGIGTGVNLMGSALLRGAALGLNRVGLKNNIMNWGTGETKAEIKKSIDDIEKEHIKKFLTSTDVLEPAGMKITNAQKATAQEIWNDPKAFNRRAYILEKLRKNVNPSKADKLAGIEELTPDEVLYIKNDPELSKFLNFDINFPGVPTGAELAAQEGIKNLITNKLGSYQQEQGKVFTKIPVVGARIQRTLDEEEEDERKRNLVNNILRQYKIDLLGGK